ncbi:MAG: ABC transporter substrate-binding protein [Flavobacteriaceae bacterium]|nr:ABC transporter substrate-binding protein [Flavobacteriaceae bacterium]
MKKLTIGGVPEHFNLPWHLAIESKKFHQKGIDLHWETFHGGTGAMCQALRDGSIDGAIILTEGIIKDIINGNPSKIVKVYVESPLLWGIHVAANSTIQSIDDLRNARIAISRFGSGSQLMAIVNAYNNGFDINNLNYEIVNNLAGGIKALTQGEADYFMWEHFTTKPYVDKGIFRRIDSVKTPWPCFVLAVRDDVLQHDKKAIKTVIKVINKQLKDFKNPLETEGLDQLLADRYEQKIEDIRAWISITKWNREKSVSKKLINQIQNKLVRFSVIEQDVHYKHLIKKVF